MRIERRKEPRTNQQLTISCRINSGNGSEGAMLMGRMRDLGTGGAGLQLAKPLRISEALRLDGLPHPDKERHCNVKWIRKTQNEYQIGVQFTG